MPRRVATGVDPKRLAMIVAVLSRHAGVALGSADVFVNVAGGVRIDEPGADLAVALAIASAARGVPVREGVGVVRRDRADRPPAARRSGRAAAGGVRETRPRDCDRAGGDGSARSGPRVIRRGDAASGDRGRPGAATNGRRPDGAAASSGVEWTRDGVCEGQRAPVDCRAPDRRGGLPAAGSRRAGRAIGAHVDKFARNRAANLS